MPVLTVMPVDISSRKIFLYSDQIDRLGLIPGSMISLRAGSAITDIVVTSSLSGNYISKGTLDSLGLPAFKELLLRAEAPDMLQIGPLIGILISRNLNPTPPHTSQDKSLQRFLNYAAAKNYISYVFSPNQTDISNKQITGYFLGINNNGTRCWIKHTFPLPDAVYDRILYRNIERKPATLKITSFFKTQSGITYFNPKFLNKWETHAILIQNPVLQNHLPHTAKFLNPEDLPTFLQLYKTVYLKPVHGSLGMGILRVSLVLGGYSCQYRKAKQTFTHILPTLDELMIFLEKHRNKRAYVIQQGLDLLKYHERVFDIRVLAQKNGQGTWTITAAVPRVASDGSIFPNIAAGGEAKNMEIVWRELFGEEWLYCQSYQTTRQISLAAAETLENALGTFCEIGLDLGIDSYGKIWIIEINSKPSRKVFPRDRIDLKQTSFKLPLDFAAYMAGFNPDQEFEPW